MTNRPDPTHLCSGVRLALVALATTILAAPISAQPLEVTAADPPSAEQGTLNLDVVIKGSGFGKSAAVTFLLAGTENPGGIQVNNVKVRGPKKLIANIDIDLGAIVDDFDIRVESFGRVGKGTELFTVLKSSGGKFEAAEFCLGITDATPGLAGDGSLSDDGYYCDGNKIDKVMVFTGIGPGFRFDTKQGKGKGTPRRYVQLNFPGGGITVNDADSVSHSYDSGLYEIDFRFDLDSGGLALEGLSESGGIGDVSIGIWIKTLDGSELGTLGYGDAPSLFSDPSLNTTCMLNGTLNAVVTRIAADAWTIESDPDNSNACLWVGLSNFAGQAGTVVDMPFDFTIVVEP